MGMNQLQPHLRTHRRIVILGGMIVIFSSSRWKERA